MKKFLLTFLISGMLFAQDVGVSIRYYVENIGWVTFSVDTLTVDHRLLVITDTDTFQVDVGSDLKFLWYSQDGTEKYSIDSTGKVIQQGALDLTTAGVRLTGDGDGAITFLGLGDGFDEDLTWNFDDVANTVDITS